MVKVLFFATAQLVYTLPAQKPFAVRFPSPLKFEGNFQNRSRARNVYIAGIYARSHTPSIILIITSDAFLCMHSVLCHACPRQDFA